MPHLPGDRYPTIIAAAWSISSGVSKTVARLVTAPLRVVAMLRIRRDGEEREVKVDVVVLPFTTLIGLD